MSDPLLRFETGDTRQLTATYSTAPNSPTLVSIFVGSGNSTCVVSLAMATASSATQWYYFFTVQSQMLYAYTWIASYANGPVVNRGQFQGIFTTAI